MSATEFEKLQQKILKYVKANNLPMLEKRLHIQKYRDYNRAEVFLQSTIANNTHVIDFLLNTSYEGHTWMDIILSRYPRAISEGFSNACKFGHIEMVHYLAEHTYLSQFIYLKEHSSKILTCTVIGGKIDIAKYVLPLFGNLTKDNCDLLINQCATENNIDLLKYVLQLAQSNNLTPNLDATLQQAFINNNVEIFDYLLRSPELKCHADVHNDNDYIFNLSYHGRNTLMQYLVFDYGIDKTPMIEQILTEDSAYKEEVNNMFAKRQLNAELQQQLPTAPVNTIKKRKI